MNLMQEIQSFTINLKLFLSNSGILISETEKLCTYKGKGCNKEDIIHLHILVFITNHPSVVLTHFHEKLLILAEGSKTITKALTIFVLLCNKFNVYCFSTCLDV
jgi:hypothetical protein